MKKHLIKCADVSYRQGFVEVATGIHAQHVNIEIWNVHSDAKISDATLDSLPDEAVVANTEIELNLHQAKMLVVALESAILAIENSDAK